VSKLLRRFLFTFRRSRFERELDEEMRFHLEMKAQELGDAYRARRAFGNPMWLREVSRDMWSWTSVERLVQDLRYGLRVLRRNPGFTAVVVVTLALGIGANTTVFSLFNAILLRELPVKEPHRLVNLGPSHSFSYPDYLDFRDQSQAFEGLCAYYPATASLSGEGTPERVQGEVVTASYFSVMGVQPKLGRAFLSAEDQAPAAVVILSHGVWVRRFGADPGTVGRTVRINSDTYTVVGIAPAGFQGARRGLAADFWVPMPMAARIMPWAAEAKLLSSRDQRGFLIHGRLKPGVTREQALAQVNLISDRIQRLSGLRRRIPVYLETAGKLPGRAGEQFVSWTGILMVVVGLLLLIACANVANLLLARAVSRKREIGIRLAIGASRTRVMRQLLTESILLSVLGAAAGVLLSLLATGAISRGELPLPYQFAWDLAPDARVFAFTAALAIIAGMAFGLAPGLRATRADLVGALKDDGGPSRGMRPGGLRDLLVVVQVALSLVLLLGAGLFLRSLGNLLAIDPGFRPENLLVMQVEPRLQGYTADKSIELYREIEERVSTLPGVRSMSLTSIVPLSGFSSGSGFRVVGGKDDASRQANVVLVGPRYFKTMGIPLLRGGISTGKRPPEALS